MIFFHLMGISHGTAGLFVGRVSRGSYLFNGFGGFFYCSAFFLSRFVICGSKLTYLLFQI